MVFLEIFRRRFSEVVTVHGYMLQKPFGAMVSSPMKKYCTDSRKRCIISTDISAKWRKSVKNQKSYMHQTKGTKGENQYGDAKSDKGICGTI